nr:hypothetical protein BgiMline_019873 [Biomphalaria glabrata]
MSCVSYFEHVAQIRTALNQDGFSWVNLTILNATRREAGVWTFKHIDGIETQASIIEQCDLKSYVKAESVDCETIQATDGVSVQCVVTRVWPQAVCLFNTSLHNTSIEYSISNVTHQHELSSQAPAYYNTTCSAKVLYTGTFDIDITVFPNITGADDNLEFRTSLHYNYTEHLKSQENKEYACNETLTKNATISQKYPSRWLELNNSCQLQTSNDVLFNELLRLCEDQTLSALTLYISADNEHCVHNASFTNDSFFCEYSNGLLVSIAEHFVFDLNNSTVYINCHRNESDSSNKSCSGLYLNIVKAGCQRFVTRYTTSKYIDTIWISFSTLLTVYVIVLFFLAKYTEIFAKCRIDYLVTKIRQMQEPINKEVDNQDVYFLHFVGLFDKEDIYCTIDEAFVSTTHHDFQREITARKCSIEETHQYN